MPRQYNMYNVQQCEFWKERVSKEVLRHALYFGDDLDDDLSQLSGSSFANSTRSMTSEASRDKIAQLEMQLQDERRKRIQVENQLKSMSQKRNTAEPA
ncbi:hypothetical protein AB1Y20_020135 [Prymnesium parvum]|uniref:Uncharacterized protein n=1 Tax=Prymnesium parvum TaxID=97485 RepID=A0AB34JWQ0_PRYPA